MKTAKEICEEIKQDKQGVIDQCVKTLIDSVRRYSGTLKLENYHTTDDYYFLDSGYDIKKIVFNFQKIKEILELLGYKVDYKSEIIMFHNSYIYSLKTIYDNDRNWFGFKYKIINTKRIYAELGLKEKIDITITACCGEE